MRTAKEQEMDEGGGEKMKKKKEEERKAQNLKSIVFGSTFLQVRPILTAIVASASEAFTVL